MIDLGLDGKGAIVAGAGAVPGRAGHGRATALRLAAAGATVACIDIDEGRATETVEAVLGQGGQAFAVLGDMTVRAEADRAVAEAVNGLPPLRACVDIIGEAKWDEAVQLSDDDWDWSIRTNLTQVFYLFRAVGQHLKDQGRGGSLVAISSVDGLAAAAFHAGYGAAKAGVISLAKTFAQELGRYGIRVNTVAPGNVVGGNNDWPEDTWATNGINPLAPPRTGDIADAALFLCSDLAQRVTGQTLVVDGGATVRDLWGLTEDVLPAFRTGIYG